MKKILLLLLIVYGINSFGQGALTCATATTITTNGTYVIGELNIGTYPTGTGLCFAGGNPSEIPIIPNARWFKFIPTVNGLINITSDIAANVATPGVDTRLSIMTGACTGPWTCIAANDDINEATLNYASAVSNVAVTAGTTYFIVWDDRWEDENYSFAFTFVAQSCFSPTAFTFIGTPTTTTASIGWTAPTSGTPIGYQFEFGLSGFVQGSGTLLTPITPSVALTGLTASSVYSFYIRTNCGTNGFSVWTGPINFNTIFMPTNLPYSMGFNTTLLPFIGWFSSELPAVAWFLNQAAVGPLTHEGTAALVSLSSTTATSNSTVISRGLNLIGGQPVTISFFLNNFRQVGNTTSTASYEIRFGNAQTNVGQTNLIATETNLTTTGFEQKTYSFTPATAGVYFISFKNISAQNTSVGSPAPQHAIIIDNLQVTQALSNNEFKTSRLSIYPNPATDLLNIKTDGSNAINAIQIVDLNGRQIVTKTFDNVADAQIDVNDLSAGMYLINITSGDQTVTKKFLKQ